MNTSRLIIGAGAAAYFAALFSVWHTESIVDRSPFVYFNSILAVVLIGGSYVWEPVRRHLTPLMSIAIGSIQTHALYLVWLTDVSPTLVIAAFTIVLAPVATFGFTFRTNAGLLSFLGLSSAAVIAIAFVVETPRMSPVVLVAGYLALGLVCYIATRGQLAVLERLRASVERQRALVDALPDVMLRLSRDGRVLDRSVDLTTRLGALASSPGKLDLARYVEQVIATGTMQTFELDRRDLADAVLHLEVRIVRSGVDEAIVIIRDVTEDRQLQQRLLITDRMSALGTLSVGIGHEINNPLMYVESNLELALEELPALVPDATPRARLVELLADANEGAHRIKRIVADLRRSVRLDAEPRGVADASNALRFASRITGNQMRYQATLDIAVPDALVVEGSEGKLSQVFLNLLMNAMQSFETADPERNRVEVRGAVLEDGRIGFTIRDNGRGIPDPIKTRIFDPFFTTKDVGKGTGLGLYVCHQIVTGCGGELRLESEQGRGTTAFVTLRAARASQPAATTASPMVAAMRILVVDDESAILRVCRRMMNTHAVTTCDDPARALELIAEHDFDVVFCDLMMPQMNGMELYHQVATRRPDAARRMVFITGGAFTSDMQAFLDQHPDRHVYKPFDRAALLAMLSRVVERTAALGPRTGEC